MDTPPYNVVSTQSLSESHSCRMERKFFGWKQPRRRCIFMCIKDGSVELIPVTPLVCLVSRAVNRRPREDAACQMMRSYAEAREPKLEIDARLVNTYLSLPMSAEPPKPRRVYIRNSGLQQYGAGCDGRLVQVS